ncbi:MAG: hypothetical protein HN929_04825 [Chloroflexi bacterium]|jgi:anti-sigma factor RsiW|nr:hypothetical protein [Chloroflexota bacterium]MBT7080776.1 hypothetical protein [Chloroflexota bacterium]MBT7289728.1 hypothetical protein [Chloroflexota bacterium]
MNCDNMKQLLISYHNNEVDPGEPDAIKAHLETCPDCQLEHRSIIDVQSKFKQVLSTTAELVSPPPDAWLAIQGRLDPNRNRFAGLTERIARATRNFLDTPVWQKRLVGSLTALTTLALVATVIL